MKGGVEGKMKKQRGTGQGMVPRNGGFVVQVPNPRDNPGGKEKGTSKYIGMIFCLFILL